MTDAKHAVASPTRVRYSVRGVGVHSVAVILGVVTALMSVFMLLILLALQLTGADVPSSRELAVPLLGPPVIAYLWGGVAAWLFNQVARRLGGLQFVLEERGRSQ